MSFSIISGIVGSISSLVSGKKRKVGEEDEEGDESAAGAPEKKVKLLKNAEGDFKKELENIQKNVNTQILEIGEKYKGIEESGKKQEEEIKNLKEILCEQIVEIKSEKVKNIDLNKRNQKLLNGLKKIEDKLTNPPSPTEILKSVQSFIKYITTDEATPSTSTATPTLSTDSPPCPHSQEMTDLAEQAPPNCNCNSYFIARNCNCFVDSNNSGNGNTEGQQKFVIDPETGVAYDDNDGNNVAPVTGIVQNDENKTGPEIEVEYDPSLSLDKIHGWEEPIKFLKEKLLVPFANQEAFLKNGVSLAKGLVIHDLSGFGLGSQMAKSLAAEFSRALGKKVTYFQRSKADVFRKYHDDSANFMEKIFDAAIAQKPSVIFLEDLPTMYSFCKTLGADSANLQNLQKHMDRIVAGEVLVIASVEGDTSQVPTSLRTPSKFGVKILPLSSAADKTRKLSLESFCSKWEQKPSPELLEEITKKTEGLTSQELETICGDAYRNAIQRLVKLTDIDKCKNCKCDSSVKLDQELLTSMEVTMEDWTQALATLEEAKQKSAEDEKKLDPYKRYSVATEKKAESEEGKLDENLGFASVGGLDEQVENLRENIMFPFANKESMKEWGIEPVRGIIFHGPPGTGKTLLAKALAAELSRLGEEKFSFFYHKGTDSYGPYVGETQGNLKSLFEKAKTNKPSILFFDEIDGLCAQRTTDSGNSRFHNGVVTTMLGLMDNIKRGEVVVIAATNRLDTLDPGLTRPGRFDKSVAFFAPKEEGRVRILEIYTKAWKRGKGEEILKEIAKQTPGYTGADLEQLCRQTFLLALRRQFPCLKESDGDMKNVGGFENFDIFPQDWYSAMNTVKPSNSNVFGNGQSQEKQLPSGVSALLAPTIDQLAKKLQPFLTSSLDKTPTLPAGKGSGVNSFLVWGMGPREAKAIDNLIIPSLISSLKETLFFTLDHEKLEKSELASLMNQILTTGQGKTVVFWVPAIDKLHLKINKGQELQPFMEHIDLIRGENVLLLATSACDTDELWEDFRPIFKGLTETRSHKVEKIDGADCRKYFESLLNPNFIPELDRVEKLTAGRNLYDILDLKAELSRASKPLKGVEEIGEELKTQVSLAINKILDAFEESRSRGEFRSCMYT